MSLPSAVHASSTNESGAPRSYCVALFANSPFSTFFRRLMNSLPSAVNVSSVIKRGASGDWEMCFCYFPDRFLRQTCVYVYMYIIFVVLVVVCFVLCRKKKEKE